MTATHPDKILMIRNLKTYFYTYAGVVLALNGVNLDVFEGETLGLVGETGCGKSVTALSVLQLVDSPGKIVDGEIWFKGEDLLKKSAMEMRKVRGNQIAIIFQDPMTYLNPVYSIGNQIAEAILLHQDLTETVIKGKKENIANELKTLDRLSSKAQKLAAQLKELEGMEGKSPGDFKKDELKQAARRRVIEVLQLVRIPTPERIVSEYPFELSGGMRQRVMVAMALSCNPELLICDEATTFLDVTTQAQIIQLLKEIQGKTRISIILITHNLGLVAESCDKLAVMYAGDVVEYGTTPQIFDTPSHPYTYSLLQAIPRLDQDTEELMIIPGSVPNLIHPPSGCRFHPRCSEAKEICAREKPEMIELEQGHLVACHMRTGGT